MLQRVAVAVLLAGALMVVLVGTIEGQCACYTADPQGPYYDAATVETVTGEIAAVERVTAKRRGWGQGVHAELSTSDGTLNVHLGPAWYLDNQEEQLEAGTEVEVTGSMVEVDGVTQMIAAEVRMGDTVVMFRNEAGYPNWAAWRRGPGPHRCGARGGPPQNR
jgi:hypothetical protein